MSSYSMIDYAVLKFFYYWNTTNMGDIHYQFGIPETLRADAVCLYDEAFGAKFSVAIRDEEKRLNLISQSLLLKFSVAAIANEKLVGLAGYQTPDGSLTKGITAKSLFKTLGFWSGLRAILIFSLYERKPQDSELLMDGIVVSQEMRGKGIGTKLLEKMKQYASENGYSRIRLDVIDTNPAARCLYERLGFIAIKTEKFEFLRSVLGFGGSTTMVFEMEKKKCTHLFETKNE